MKLPLFQVDAFTSRPFSGNPAAVVPLERWLPDETMRAIANENNLSETAFFVAEGEAYGLRWFTPTVEVALCGHATLASAFVLFTEIDPSMQAVAFDTRSGRLHVRRAADRLQMTLPRWRLERVTEVPAALSAGLGARPADLLAVAGGDNLFVVLGAEHEVRDLNPDFGALAALHPAGVIVTAPGTESDCVCRYFAPSYGIPEDPGTGSIHCALAPYWAERLGKSRIHSRQLSARGAELFCEAGEQTTLVAGAAVKYLEGTIEV